MDHETPSANTLSLGTEKLFDRILYWFRVYKCPALASLIVGFLAHMFAFANKLVTPAELSALFKKGATTVSGRWGLELLSHVLPNYSMPWLYGVMSIVLITVAVCFIIHMFGIKNKVLQAVTAGLVISFPSLTGTFSYMFTSSSYAVSFLLAVLAAFFASRKRWVMYLPAVVCTVLSVSIYQSYIAITASLLVLVLIQQTLQETEDVKKIFVRGVGFVLFLGASLGIYWAITQWIYACTETELGAYASRQLSFGYESPVKILGKIYGFFWAFFRYGTQGLITSKLSRCIHFGCMLLVGIEIVCWAVHNKKAGRIALLLFLILILPMSINCMYIFTAWSSVHTLVLYSFIAIYILTAIVIDNGCLVALKPVLVNKCRRLSFDIIVVCMCAVICINTFIANEAYLNMYLRYENSYSFCTALIADIQMTPGYTSETRVALLGTYEDPSFYENFDNLDSITGVAGVSPNVWSKWYLFEYYCGYRINFAYDWQIEEVVQTEEYAQMSTYPDNGSIQMIGDVLVVKLSE